MRVLSVDLGTSNTVAVLAAHGRAPEVVEVDGSATMPSALFAAGDTLVTGREAQRRARIDPTRYEPNPKRRIDDGSLLLGDQVVPVTEALAAVLRRVRDEVARRLGGAAPDAVRLTHPARWGPVRRGVLLSAARMAGLGDGGRTRLSLVPEPVAAAAHFASLPGRAPALGRALAVVDLGAGTVDCAVLSATATGFTVLSETGLSDLGGLDIDHAVVEHLGRQVAHRDPSAWARLVRPETTADRRSQRDLADDVRAAKEALSRQAQTDIALPGQLGEALLTRSELESLARPLLRRAVDVLADAVRIAGVAPAELVAIHLVGGTSRIPLVAALVTERFGVLPVGVDSPETAVALGAHRVPAGDSGPPPGRRGAPPPTRDRVITPRSPTPPGAARPIPPPRTNPVPPARTPPPLGSSRRRGVLVGAAVLGLVSAAVGAVVVGVRSGGEPAPPLAAACDDRQADARGLTPCLRELAGPIADADCAPGAGADVTTQLGVLGATATCRVPGDGDFVVTYLHADDASRTGDAVMLLQASGADPVRGDWSGAGLRGDYSAARTDAGALLVFEMVDRPLLGVLRATTGDPGPQRLVEVFDNRVRPGAIEAP